MLQASSPFDIQVCIRKEDPYRVTGSYVGSLEAESKGETAKNEGIKQKSEGNVWDWDSVK